MNWDHYQSPNTEILPSQSQPYQPLGWSGIPSGEEASWSMQGGYDHPQPAAGLLQRLAEDIGRVDSCTTWKHTKEGENTDMGTWPTKMET